MPDYAVKSWGGCKFTLPDKPSVFQVLEFDSKRLELEGLPALVTLWEMAKVVISGWECEAMPDFRADLTQVEDARAARIIQWAAVAVSAWRRELDKVPKNS